MGSSDITGTVDGNKLAWKQAITVPMALTIECQGTVSDGDWELPTQRQENRLVVWADGYGRRLCRRRSLTEQISRTLWCDEEEQPEEHCPPSRSFTLLACDPAARRTRAKIRSMTYECNALFRVRRG
jgi:hypothetical protein